jgi:hypothetical protein
MIASTGDRSITPKTPSLCPRDFVRTPEQMIDLCRVITMNNLVRTIAPAPTATFS